MTEDRKICVGMIAGAHGVRGLVRLRSFTEEPEAVVSYGALSDEDGAREFDITLKSAAKDYFVAALEGVTNKETAEALRGTKLYVSRDALPKPGKREYYEADLIGLKVQDGAGEAFGAVMGVYNYGGGPFLEIGKGKKDSFMLPFTEACVPKVDIKEGRIEIAPPEGWLKDEKAENE